MAASTYRAAQLRNATGSSKPIRNVTPFGIIRNQSPLGNGVSVIRVSLALEFDDRRQYGSTKNRSAGGGDREVENVDYDGAMTLLKKIHLEEKELYTKIAMLANQQQLQMNQQQSTYNLKQKALVDYVSNGELERKFCELPFYDQPHFRITDLLFYEQMYIPQWRRHFFRTKRTFDMDHWTQFAFHLWKMPSGNFAKLPKMIDYSTKVADNN